MVIILMCVAGVFLAMSMTVVIFATTSNNNELKDLGVANLRWVVVWLMLFLSFFYIHSLQEELETYKVQEQAYGKN